MESKNPEGASRTPTVRPFSARSPVFGFASEIGLLATLLFVLLLAPPAHSQGCNECRETIGQTPARTQIGYRSAILLMIVASGSIFTAGVVILRRFR